MSFPRLLAFICVLSLASAAPVLPPDEVEALRVTLDTLGKRNWDFSSDLPCNTSLDPSNVKYTNAVDCNCTSENDTDVCHVTRIYLKDQNLNGSLPPELVRLPFLRVIDLSRNYLNGTIPPQWGSMKLTIISLLGNRLTGSIPKELANITTLEELVLENNQLSGTIPPEFGNFTSIRRLLLISNNLTGELPPDLAKLTTLADFRISDNNFTGSIPIYIQNWANITKLVIQASGLTGPIPSGIASLTKLTDLIISDLNGNIESDFPSLNNMANLDTLILRSCNIRGSLPKDFGQLKIKDVLDLSFNKLTGSIPDFSSLNADNIYLTGNSLTGRLPGAMPRGASVDLSYNNITFESPEGICQQDRLNLFANSRENSSGISSCISRSCEQKYSLHINCGGGRLDDKGSTYEDDRDYSGPSNFFRQNNSNWGFSNTGHFVEAEDKRFSFVLEPPTSSIAGKNAELYKNARRSPLSLTYYGFCLANGNYTVNLHFAEIVFTDDGAYKSLGRRVFDVYIQGKRELKDFNIENEAGGVNKPIIRSFAANVTDETLEIRFYWAGKGTTAIPEKGEYGPLISAISATHPDYKPPSRNGNSISAGAIVGIVVAVLSIVFLVLGILWWKGCLRRKDSLQHDLKGLDLQTGSFTLRQIKAATNNFDLANKIGEGGFGPVFKGVLLDGTIIAVKQLSSKSKQGNREFVTEIGMISALQHPHLVKLYGCCIEGNQLLLVYEYLENNSLARALFGPEEHQLHLDWPTRHMICIGIARGLAYLHEESRLKIVHRDIKATNVLLDKNLVPKISDFGLAKLDDEDNTHISTRIAGTFGYMAPEYAMRGYLTDKADVYSFGVVLLEIVSGRSNTGIKPKEESFYLIDWANSLKVKGNLLELVDPRLDLNFNKGEVMTAINVALLCTNPVAAERPSMSAVVSLLVEGSRVGQFVSESSILVDKMSPKEMAMTNHNDQVQDISMDVPFTASSASTSDLYPINMDTSYWEKRDP